MAYVSLLHRARTDKIASIIILAIGIISPIHCPYSANPLVIPPHLTSVAIPTFQNKTTEPELDIQVTDAVRNAFMRDNTLAIRSEDVATSILDGSIESYLKSPYAFDASERIIEYKISIHLSLTFHDNIEQKDRLTNKGVEVWRIYSILDESGNRLDDEALEDENKIKLIELASDEVLNSIFGDW